MNHARTLPRYVGIAGLVAGLLAPVPSLAAVNPDGLYVMSTQSTGVKTGQYIEAAATAAYQPYMGGSTRLYTKQMVPVATSTLRKGALAALGRGVMHPGLQVAILAAGFVWSQQDGIQVPAAESGLYSGLNEDLKNLETSCSSGVWYHRGDFYGTPGGLVSNHAALASKDSSISYQFGSLISSGGTSTRIEYNFYINGNSRRQYFHCDQSGAMPTVPDLSDALEPITEDDYPDLDQHIPPQLYGELVNSEDDIPEWQDAISILPSPQSSVVPTNEQNVAPEVATAVGRWAENMAAQLEGQEAPNPDASTDGKTADEAMYEDTRKPIPPFGEVEPEWQVETIDSLPSYSIGLGGGSCPAPNVIEIPLYGTITLDWQPACDLAGMLRGAVIGVCMILSLYIVLRGS